MGAILASPDQNSKVGGRDVDNNNTNNNNTKQHKQNHVPFGKFHIVQECFPTYGKENKFFTEKVPSYWSKTKCEAKKKTKPKEVVHSGKETFKLVITDQLSIDPSDKSILSTEKHFYGSLNLSETLKYIGCYIYLRCRNLDGLKPSIVVGWIRGVDRSLVLSGWQEMGFVSQPNMIVLYMLLREVIPSKVRSVNQLKAVMMSTLYMCYSYNGHEISYPLKPFLFDGDRAGFWARCMSIISLHSGKLLRVNKEPGFYNEIQHELKTFGRSLERKER